jgi:hypothetical protein
MKQLVLFIFCLLCLSFASFAGTQTTDSTYKDYVGKYIFPDGSGVDEVEITISDTTLTITSTQGTATMSKLGVDSFSMTYQNGTIAFKRDTDNKVNKIIIYVMGMELTGDKQKAATTTKRKELYFLKKEYFV